jgi:hypothetical protein
MLRALLAVLIAANLLLFAFTHGWFDGVMGLHAIGDREPERLARQVHPELITMLPKDAAASAVAEARAQAQAGSCYEAGPFSAADSAAVEATLKANLPAGSWADNRGESVSASGTQVTHNYRVASADAALATRLADLKLGVSRRGFNLCVKPAADRPR